MLGSSGVLRWSLSWITRAPLAPAACTGPPADGAAGGQPLCSAPPESSAPGPSVAPFIENGCTSQKLRSRAGEKRGRRGSGARSIPSSTCWSDSGARGVEGVGEARSPRRPTAFVRTRSEAQRAPPASGAASCGRGRPTRAPSARSRWCRRAASEAVHRQRADPPSLPIRSRRDARAGSRRKASARSDSHEQTRFHHGSLLDATFVIEPALVVRTAGSRRLLM